MKILFPALIISFLCSSALAQQSDNPNNLTAPDGASVIIDRDEFGVPHITAENELGVFFGQGFAVAEDRLDQMDLFRRAAEGTLSEIFGTFQLDADKESIRMHYTPEERQEHFDNLDQTLKIAFQAYTDGVNAYVELARTDRQHYLHNYFLAAPLRDWSPLASVAVTQYFMRIFGGFGGDELDRLQELQDNGESWFEENRPINDPNAPTTIPGGSGLAVREVNYNGPAVDSRAVREIENRKHAALNALKPFGIPTTFGSFATLVHPNRSALGTALLLGAPQMGAPVQNAKGPLNEVELISPTLHVGGVVVSGIPGIIIGHNEHYSWTLTSGLSDNSDVFIEELETEELLRYKFDGEFRDIESFERTIEVLSGNPVEFSFHRTIHGPVIGEDLVNKQAFTQQMTYWNEELTMAEAFYNVWKGETLEDFESAVLQSPMSFNVFYAGKDQNIKFWHIGKYQDRGDGIDPRLPHMGNGSDEWTGFIPSESLPSLENPDQGYFVNWNNKPSVDWDNGDNTPWGNDTGLTNRVSQIEQFIAPINLITFEDLKGVPVHISDTGTFQQIIEWTPDGTLRDENIVPPGQSGFFGINGFNSPHIGDQWEIFQNDEFKDMIFLQPTGVSIDDERPSGTDIMEVYPNPFSGDSHLTVDLNSAEANRLEIFDILGRKVNDLSDQLNKDILDLKFGSGLPAGTYWISLSGRSGTTIASFVKLP